MTAFNSFVADLVADQFPGTKLRPEVNGSARSIFPNVSLE
jgi:hypothetical protein